MANCKPVSTPLCTSEKLSLHQGSPLGPKDATQYKSLVGALQYLTLIRPYIAFLVKKGLSIFTCSDNCILDGCQKNTMIY
jgi:hypothetical protein